MADFKIAYSITKKTEGGYSNNPNDKGGETYKGVARKAYPEWAGWKIVDELRRATGFPTLLGNDGLLNEMVLQFYKTEFWDRLLLGQITNQLIANELFDTAVNMGTGTAGLYLQRCLNVSNQQGKYYADLKTDGAIGPVTIAALNKHPRPQNVLKALNCLQGSKYITICEANPLQEEFFNGWITRVFEYADQ